MRSLRIVRHWVHSLLRRSRLEADLERELQIHVEQLTREYMDTGMTESDARLAARRAFGSTEVTKEQCRDTRRLRWLEDVLTDLRYALRLWGALPGFTAVALISLSLGIGANTAIFSLVDAVLLRVLPVPEPQQLMPKFPQDSRCVSRARFH